MSINQMTLGEKIQSLRESKKMTQKEVATILGVSVGTVAEWEAGDASPNNEILVKMGALFSAPLSEWMDKEEPVEETVEETDEAVVEMPIEEIVEPALETATEQKERASLTKKKKHLIPLIIGGVLGVVIIALVCWLLFGPTTMSADELYDQVSKSVVVVSGDKSTGTGFFIDDEGTVVTNYHVIEKCRSAEIVLADGSKYNVDKVLGYSEEKDIAILSTKCNKSVPLKVRKTKVKTGEQVYAIGTTEGIFEGTLSEGIVSSAERELDGLSYIQFTAPVSHGNSGGPLLDKSGRVVGIVSAGWSEGQNINFAIPIAEVDNVSRKNPTTLAKLFKQTVETMSDWDFFYYDDFDKYVLVFELSDEDEKVISSRGFVEIKIVNSEGHTVYNKSHAFTESDFAEWTFDQTIEKYLASIYVTPNDITTGTSAEGKVYFTVSGDDYYFEETVIDFYDLPVKPITLNLPNLPTTVSDNWTYGVWTKTRIDQITYKVEGDSLYLYFSGEKTYDQDGNDCDDLCVFCWKLYDADNYLIDSGSVYTSNLSVGDKFKDQEAYIWGKIKPGQEYTLVLADSGS